MTSSRGTGNLQIHTALLDWSASGVVTGVHRILYGAHLGCGSLRLKALVAVRQCNLRITLARTM